ncbi:magnesium/cobalt transporter CorA [Thalassoglobus neptunius]|uniref:magnesium/cobalt transporter CorA n=1 Tax=Thalassoglobus neptunius TaxID=1938619 RepID=UPI001E641C69|nr:magnesium/cobalt transporter CorA [Thalassoglobus neptunius]
MIRKFVRKVRPKRQVFRRRTPIASPPGTVRSDTKNLDVKLRQIRFSKEHLEDQRIEMHPKLHTQLQDHSAEEAVLWLDVVGVGNGDAVGQIGQKFGLHSLALEDVVHTHQRSKYDDYEDHIFFVARMLKSTDTIESEQVSLFLGSGFVISFQELDGDCFEPIRERIRQHTRIRGQQADYLFYTMIDAIIDGYFPRLEAIGARLEDIEEKILNLQDEIAEVYDLRRELMWIRKNVWQLREALQSMMTHEHPLISSGTRTYMRDCHDHTVQLIEVVEVFRDQCANLRDLSLAMSDVKANEVMKTLTIFATIFMPMSFVAGVYGMNFDNKVSAWNMPELEWTYGYPYALGLMAAIGIALLIYFWKKGWLKD